MPEVLLSSLIVRGKEVSDYCTLPDTLKINPLCFKNLVMNKALATIEFI